jgi:hypothetical protein
MSREPYPLSLDDLALLDGQAVMARNADILHLSRREYHLDGLRLRFERIETTQTPQAGDIWLALLHAGSIVHLRVSRQWADSLAGAAGISLEGLGRDKLELLCLIRLSPHLPKSVQLLAVAYSLADLHQEPHELYNHGAWRGVHTITGEVSGYVLQIFAEQTFPVYAFIASFDPYLKRSLAPRMASLPLSVPLVAARWTADAGDLIGLEVGDVLLIG